MNILLFTVGCISLMMVAEARGNTDQPQSLPGPSFYVDRNAPAGGDGSPDLPFQTIQAALNAATNNSVIAVKPGTYAGTSNRNLSFGGKNLILISDRGWEETVINAGGATNCAFVFNSTNENHETRVSGFTITNSGTGVLSLAGSAPIFINCSFISNTFSSFRISNSSPTILNCQFYHNSSPSDGAAIAAVGASTVKVSHCTFSENAGAKDGGQIFSGYGAQIILHNSIVWHSYRDAGGEIVTNGGTVLVNYCDVRGGYPGSGNLNVDPQFEPEGTRLRSTSPCIDQGAAEGLPGLSQFTRFDMDGEARLDHGAFSNTHSIVDIGADEFVYRIQFPTHQGVRWVLTDGNYRADTNYFSEVDEASGVAYLGATRTGPVIAVIDDEDRDRFHVYQLNADASAIANSHAIPLLNPLYRNDRGQQETFDMEGLTFDPRSQSLYVITSQTRRNRYRDVDSSPPIIDPVVDPPSNDYDRRRAMLVRIKLDASLTNALRAEFFEPEQVHPPKNTGYEPLRGLAAHMRQSFSNNPALGERTVSDRVLIAWNGMNKFGTPANGVRYPGGTPLPYSSGGPSNAAGASLGEFLGTTGLYTNSGVRPNTPYYYKIWAIDAHTNYTAGIVAGTRTDGVPRIFINEFLATGDPDWIE
ncbi:MAG TPA: right-handed parallel beta-helix repeat-containing protein, partial [Verrucomicrobiae bacterium]|nr:right-handed parallel beta-helix repeat-containing protein [Verrucomicrobiae bacterium]